MKTTAYYSVFSANTIEQMLDHLVKNQDMTIAHHLDNDEADYYVLKDASGNSTDIFHSKNNHIQEGFFGIRMNVDDFAAASKHLEGNGYTPLFPPVDSKSNIFCIYMSGNERFNVILFQHKK